MGGTPNPQQTTNPPVGLEGSPSGSPIVGPSGVVSRRELRMSPTRVDPTRDPHRALLEDEPGAVPLPCSAGTLDSVNSTHSVFNPNVLGEAIGRTSHPDWYTCETLRLAILAHVAGGSDGALGAVPARHEFVEATEHERHTIASLAPPSERPENAGRTRELGPSVDHDDLAGSTASNDGSAAGSEGYVDERAHAKRLKRALKLLPAHARRHVSREPYHGHLDAMGKPTVRGGVEHLRELRQLAPELVPPGLKDAFGSTTGTLAKRSHYRPDEVLITFHGEGHLRQLRELTGVTEQVLKASLGDNAVAWFSAATPGKSEAQFYCFGNFAAKEVSDEEFDTLIELDYLCRLVGHFERFPRTLLPKIAFVVTVTRCADKTSKTFVITKNVFETPHPLDVIYDLKGSTVGREGTDSEGVAKGKNACGAVLLKDNDVRGCVIRCGPAARECLLSQLRHDLEFLEDCKIVDYSFVIGLRRLEPTARASDHAADGGILSELKRSDEEADAMEMAYVGIIDALQTYNTRKLLETQVKGVVYDASKISVVHPHEFSRRLFTFIAAIIE